LQRVARCVSCIPVLAVRARGSRLAGRWVLFLLRCPVLPTRALGVRSARLTRGPPPVSPNVLDFSKGSRSPCALGARRALGARVGWRGSAGLLRSDLARLVVDGHAVARGGARQTIQLG